MGKKLNLPSKAGKRSLNLQPIANSLLNASAADKKMIRSIDSYGAVSRKSQSSRRLASYVDASEFFENRSGEVIKREPGSAMAHTLKFKFAASCLFIDDSKPLLDVDKK